MPPLCLGMLALVVPAAVLPMLTLDVLVFLIALLDWLLTKGDIVVEREVPPVQAVQRAFPVKLVFINRGNRALRLRIVDDCPGQTDAFPMEEDIGPNQTLRLTYTLEVDTRGHHPFGSVTVRWRSPLGLWRQQRRFDVVSALRVYPSFHQLRTWGVKARQSEQKVPVRARRRPGGENEFQRLRPYVFGDSYRHIDWKATAKKREFVTREFGQESNQNVIFLLDAGRMMSVQNGDVTSFDHALNAALMMGQVALRHGDRVGLLAFDSDVRVWLKPKGGARSGGRLIRGTYDLQPSLKEPDYTGALQYLASRVRRRSLVVLFTAVSDAQSADTMRSLVGALSRRHLPLCVWLRDMSVEQLVVGPRATHMDHYVAGAASEWLGWREKALAGLQARGGLVVDCDPGELTPRLLSRYLEVKARRLL